VYLRLFAEMNGPWNAYSAFTAGGRAKPGHSTRAFRRAWRRIAIVVRGGRLQTIDRRLRRLHMRALDAAGDLPRAPVALMWVPHNSVALSIAANAPSRYWPGARYVDWVGTDFYGQNPDWGALDRLYRQFRRKPFVFGEWALWGSDSPAFVQRLFAWARHHRRTRMLIYNEGARANGPFQLSRYPRATRVLRRLLP
jgi:beta-mannanase